LGNIVDALDGFGIYVAKVPVVRRKEVKSLTNGRETA